MKPNKILLRPLWLLPTIAVILVVGAVVPVAATTTKSEGDEDEPVGYGYKVKWAEVDKDTSESTTLRAILQVVKSTSVYGRDIKLLSLTASLETDDRLRVHITDATHPRWELPTTLFPRTQPPPPPPPRHLPPPSTAATTTPLHLTTPTTDLLFSLHRSTPFTFTVTRKSTNTTLFSTTASSFVFKPQYLHLTSSLPGRRAHLYGLGEQTRPGLLLARNSTLTLWNADIAAFNVGLNLYGSHPFYMDVRENGLTHGVLLLNSNGMDVEYSGESVSYKVIGGVFDFYFFGGPTPVALMDQYTHFIGRPAPMPYWAFGFHQCRYGYHDVNELESVVAGYAEAKIPLDVMWSDIDYMDAYKDFTFDPVNYPLHRMRRFVRRLHKNGQKYVVIVDPGINTNTSYGTFIRGMKQDVFVKRFGKPYLGEVWPGPVYFPDFLNPATDAFWTDEIRRFLNLLPVDGLWIDMNEVSNFNSSIPARGSTLDDPPYKINDSGERRPIINKTMPPSALHYGNIPDYNVHNLYGFLESIATQAALAKLTKTRPFVLSRSTFVGSGKYTAHWTGDNAATWNDLQYSIPSILNSGLFGIPMVGADICGFMYNTTEELCRRWIQLGAFYPFSRDHSGIGTTYHELYRWKSVAKTARKVLGLRYRLLPYFYTLMFEAHTVGVPIARPLFFSFPEDANTYGISKQFLLGKGVLVSPVLTPGAVSVKAYIPKGNWFNLFDYSHSVSVSAGRYVTLSAPPDHINVHVRGDNKKWSFVVFTATSSKNTVTIKSEVRNREFAVQQKWFIGKITILGLKSGMNMKASMLQTGGGVIRNHGARLTSNADKNGKFNIAEISGLQLPIGHDFVLQLKYDR
ncbi:hypothetical protein vseg_014700 [Gypsophila vaccaria]